MTHPSRSTSGFTLVELLLVVVILGILAGVILPRLTGADDAAKAAAKMTVAVVRERIALYKAEHEAYPSAIDPSWFHTGNAPSSPFWPDHPTPIQVANNPEKTYPNSKQLSSDSTGTFWYNRGNGQFFARVPNQGRSADTIALFNYVNSCEITSLAD